MFNNLKRIIKLVKENGEKIVLVDNENKDNDVVIMKLDDYEKLVSKINKTKQIKDLTDKNLIDILNKNIAEWKEEDYKNKDLLFNNDFFCEKLDNNDFNNEVEDESLYYYNDNEFFTHFNVENEDDIDNREKKAWNIPIDIQEGADK